MTFEKGGDEGWIDAPNPILKSRICLRWRILAYLVPWLGTVASFFFLFFPESPAETSDSPLQQSLQILLLAPLMAALGIAHYSQWPDFPSQSAVWIAALAMLGHAGLMLSCRRLVAVAFLLILQVLLLGFAVKGYFHLSNLSPGG
jgi:hypothetical protein